MSVFLVILAGVRVSDYTFLGIRGSGLRKTLDPGSLAASKCSWELLYDPSAVFHRQTDVNDGYGVSSFPVVSSTVYKSARCIWPAGIVRI